MLLVELRIVVVTVLRAQQFQVLIADNDDACLLEQGHDVLLLIERAGILQHFVVVAESFQAHTAEAVNVFKVEVEVANEIVGEVEAGHLKEQLVLLYGVGLIGNEQDEVGIALGLKDAGGNGVAVGEHVTAALPDIAHVELSTMETAASLHAVDDHAGHGADPTFGIFLHDGLHIAETALGITLIEFAQSADEDKLVAVGP